MTATLSEDTAKQGTGETHNHYPNATTVNNFSISGGTNYLPEAFKGAERVSIHNGGHDSDEEKPSVNEKSRRRERRNHDDKRIVAKRIDTKESSKTRIHWGHHLQGHRLPIHYARKMAARTRRSTTKRRLLLLIIAAVTATNRTRRPQQKAARRRRSITNIERSPRRPTVKRSLTKYERE